MNCLDNYIGLKGCNSASAPGSGLFINSLPGLPSEFFSHLANSDQVTASNVKADIELSSQSQLLSDLATALSDRYKIRSLARQIDIGTGLDTGTALAASNIRKGLSFDPENELPYGYTRSNLLGMSIDSALLYVDSFTGGADITFQIINTETSAVLFTSVIPEASVTTGWNTVQVNRVFEIQPIALVFTAQAVDTFAIPISQRVSSLFSDCLCDVYRCDACAGVVSGVTYDGSTFTFNADYSRGVSASISLVCSFEKLICSNKQLFKRVLWYLEGHHAMFHALYTPSFMRANTVDRKRTEELKDEYFQRYAEELSRVAKGINLEDGDLCLECHGGIRNQYYTP